VTKVSDRANRFWHKLAGFYGTGLTEKFGKIPPGDWCEIIDDSSNDVLRDALVEIRAKHVNWPPTLPEFESIVARLQRPKLQGPTTQERLTDFVLKNYKLTFNQIRQPWKFLFSGHPGYGGPDSKPSPDYAVVGVVVPADGAVHGYRVMVMDMQMGKVA
jgi:hypothetical protein